MLEITIKTVFEFTQSDRSGMSDIEMARSAIDNLDTDSMQVFIKDDNGIVMTWFVKEIKELTE